MSTLFSDISLFSYWIDSFMISVAIFVSNNETFPIQERSDSGKCQQNYHHYSFNQAIRGSQQQEQEHQLLTNQLANRVPFGLLSRLFSSKIITNKHANRRRFEQLTLITNPIIGSLIHLLVVFPSLIPIAYNGLRREKMVCSLDC